MAEDLFIATTALAQDAVSSAPARLALTEWQIVDHLERVIRTDVGTDADGKFMQVAGDAGGRLIQPLNVPQRGPLRVSVTAQVRAGAISVSAPRGSALAPAMVLEMADEIQTCSLEVPGPSDQIVIAALLDGTSVDIYEVALTTHRDAASVQPDGARQANGDVVAESEWMPMMEDVPALLSPAAEERAIPQLNGPLREEYARLFAQCEIRPARAQAVDQIVDRLVAARARYAGLESVLGTPWCVVGVIHSLESGQQFDRHLHNGDPLTARTTHEPKGRPARGNPPFTWEASAQDALQLKGFDRWQDWSVAGALFKLEQYNGWGYRQFHPDVLSPYLWSYSQYYEKGKYVADNHFDPTAVSRQCGAAVLLRRMVDRGLIPAWTAPPSGPLFSYSTETVAPHGVALQHFLNTLPDIHLDEDGKLGPSSSQAVRHAFGHLLRGDPRA